ncbi:MAG: DUF3999 domain-containing protein [Acidobacteriia bacterium]|nr:DUF3999 domain-containing protein [Terriglobia bacterium]
MRKLVLSLLALALLARADFSPARWALCRALSAGQAQQVCALTLDRTVYAGARADLADLRLVRNGQEIPYVLEALTGSVEQSELRPDILDRSVVPDAGLELTLDLGSTAKHNRLRIATAETNFRTRVRLETSADGRSWAVARADGYVFDFSQGGRSVSVLTVDYPLSTRRYVRATFFGWMRTGAVTGAWLAYYRERPSVWQTIARIAPARREEQRSSLLVLDLGAARLPQSRLRVETGGPPFHRACDIEFSADGQDWRYVAGGVLYRYRDEETSLLEFPEQHERYLRLRIFNGDDRPVPVRSVVVEAVERRLKFLPDAAGGYTLYYGNPEAKPPAYDLGSILARRAPAPEIQLAAGPEEPNPVYRPPPPPRQPWSERHPELLYGTLAAAVLGMGYITVRFLIGAREAGRNAGSR